MTAATARCLSPSPDPDAPIVQAADAAGLGPDVLGGKAAQLVELGRLGARVPDWFCLPARACARLPAPLPSAVEQALLSAFDRTFGPDAHVAVRSSAQVEDSATASFAGQFESFLFVTRDTLLQRVHDCIASGTAARVARYRELQGIRAEGGTAVIVQRMVASASSGVLFTANPTSGAAGETAISAAFGLGEGVVAGKADCDTWFVDSRTGQVRRTTLEHKRTQVVFDQAAGAGTRIVEVPAEDAARPVLSPAQIDELTRLGQAVASARGAPQDIEFAYDAAGTLFVLQARAITTLDRRPDGHAATFDNANIVESYPGVTGPLTFSFIQEAYARTFRPAARRFGIPAAKLEEHAALFQHLVARIDGHVYYDLGNWYRLYQLVPGFEGRLEAWEKALGLAHREVKAGSRRGLTQLKVATRIVSQLVSLRGDAERFLREMDAIFARERRRELDALDAHGVLEALEELERDISWRFAVTLVNDFYAQQFHELAGKLIDRWDLAGDDPSLRNALFCGEGRMESVAPARSVLRIAAEVRASSMARALFESSRGDADLWALLAENPALSPIRAGFLAHLDAYGDRTLHELKLETPSLAEDPRLLVAAVRNCVRGGQRVEDMEARERGVRLAAERAVTTRLRGHPLRRAIFQWVLGGARRSVAYRESMRLARTRAYGIAKRLYRALGDRLSRARVIASADDIFFLTCQEVAGAVRGSGVTSDLQAVVALRRAESARFERRSLPGRFTTRGIVAAARREAHSMPPHDARLLRGTGCSRGVVRGKAKVILEPRDDLRVDGEILIAPMTDPGWVLLMVSAAGIVSERGSPLSHTAIVGRELGIPTVVGVPGATRLIQEGAEVELDGALGTVAILEGSR